MNDHTLEHALHPAASRCSHNMADITHCVICERRLDPDRDRVDTCGKLCSNRLQRLQNGSC